MKNNILKSIFISLILLVGATNAWALDFTSGTIVYFDNTETQWSKIYLRVGKSDYNSAYQVSTKVSGTQNLYKYTIPSWGGYEAFSFANSQGWTDNNSIYQPWNDNGTVKPNGSYAITGQTEYFKWNLDKMRLFIPASKSNKEHNCQYYNTNVEYNNYQRTVTITSPTNGSITVTYKDENDDSQSKNSGNFKVAQTCIITVSATPSAGYELKSLKIGGSTHTSGNTYIVRGDVTIEASFAAKTYSVTLDANGGTGGTGSVTATYNAAMPSATMPTRNGYTFKGYYDATSGGTQYYKADGTSNKNWDRTSATTLYAQWELATYTITYDNLKGATHSNPEIYTIESATITFTAPTTKPTGYTFVNWTPESIAKGSTGDVTVTASWTASTSTVTLNQEEATTQGTTSVTATYGSAMPAITKPARTGYTFGGYYTEKNGGGTQYYDKDGKSAKNSDLQEDITLYAKWTINSHQLTWDVNGGNALTGDYASGSVEYGTKITAPADPTRIGYTFNGWSPSPIATTMPDEALTYTAQWTVNTYTITLDPQSGTGGTTSVTATYDAAMPSITIPTAPTGYEFGGYFDGDTQYYDEDGKSAKNWNIAENTTLYAKWTAIKYTITYENLSGATHTNPSTYTIEDAITFSAPSARNGYTFVGWHPASITAGSIGDKTVTAIWKEKDANTVYLRANDMWKADGAKLAVYAWNDSENTWVNFEYDDCTGDILMADIPAKYTGIKFARLNPNPDDNNKGNNGYNFANAWNETSDLNIPTDNKNLYDLQNEYIYLKPNSNWRQAKARFAARFFKSSGSGEAWKDMTDADGDGYYSCEKPDGYDWVIFCRMNPATTANNWDNKWNQTTDQGIPDNNCFEITDAHWGDGEDGIATGHWDNNHWDNSQWTTYTAPTYTVTINATTNGTIEVAYGGKTYTSGQTINNVPIHTELNITFTPKAGYTLTNPQVTYADQIAEGVYSICGPSVISAAFTPRGETRVIYLRPNDDWLHDDAIFVAHAWNSDGNSDYVLTTKDNDYTGSYSCTIDSKYDHILFARLDPADKGKINLENAWNKTKDLEIVESIYTTNNQTRFAIGDKVGGEGEDKDLYNGEWETNSPIWGITADFNLWHAEDAIFRGYPGKVDILLHSKTHQFVLYNIKTDTYCHNNGTYTRGNSGQWWSMDGNTQENCKLVADVDKALYHFQMQYRTQVGTFKKQISITYPNTDVYYLAYQEGDDATSFRKSHAIDKINEGEKQDIVSFFVNIEKSPYIYLLDQAGNELAKNPIVGTGGDNPNMAKLPGKRNADATLHVGAGCGVEKNGVYNFILHQEGNEAQIDAAATHLYTGNYYIRTDASEGGWNDFRQKSNQMTYSSYAESHSNFNHYFCKWVENNNGAQSNVKFTIANDYSYSLSDTLNRDNFIIKDKVDEGCLPESANVRFGWDSRTNEISRAYIKGSSTQRFLVLVGKDDNLKDKDGNELTNNEVTFIDQNNWIYQVDVTVNNATQVKLIAEYNGHTQYFKGSAEESTSLLSSTAASSYKIRLVYDFKSNHIITAVILDGGKEVTGDDALGADMMVIRKDQEAAEQLTFNPNTKQLSKVGTVYAVMTFTSDWINGSAEPRERSLYWVSFPFDVKIADVFGFGEYAEQWIIQYYDGAERAEKGLFADSGTYWKYIFDTNTTLKAGEGYVLVLDLNKVEFPNGATEVSLYFPSTGPLNIITGELPTAAIVPEHWCNIEREWTEDGKTYYHKWTDSHWNLIGVPGFADIKDFDVTAYHFTPYTPDISFYYAFDLKNSTYTVASAATNFQAMYAYMVQFAGTINWVSKTVKGVEPQPKELAARRNSNSDEPERVVLRLELAQGKEQADRTFIQLEEEGATAEFDLSRDLTKIINKGANIYTLAGEYNIQVAGNALPMEEALVPVGVEIAAAGEYTFRMPDGTEGMVVELIDFEANITTNMLLSDYTVTLQKGSCENRFALHIQPQKSGVSTSIENVDEGVNGGEAVMKYLIDGKLFIRTADGVLYDAQGHVVR